MLPAHEYPEMILTGGITAALHDSGRHSVFFLVGGPKACIGRVRDLARLGETSFP